MKTRFSQKGSIVSGGSNGDMFRKLLDDEVHAFHFLHNEFRIWRVKEKFSLLFHAPPDACE
jgi:hypothetical protein